MSKKFLRKNEFRMDLNPKHFGKEKKPHPAYISGKRGHMFYANDITHSQKVKIGDMLYDSEKIVENPNKLSKDTRETRISPPFWQREKQFSEEKLNNFRFSKKTKRGIKKYNKKFKK